MSTPPAGGRVVLWDFDGTLAERPGLWSRCLIETLDEAAPDHGVTADDLRPHLAGGFPWHRPERLHPELSEPEAWWASVESLLARSYRGVGIEPERARALARVARARYVDPTVGWRLFPDTVPVLERLRGRGWRHVILSNHVPELEVLVAGLGLAPLVDRVLTSASIGAEKPHPAAFEQALAAAGRPGEVWMVGDNETADVAGAEAVGIPAILVRREPAAAARRAGDLEAAAALIEAGV